MSLNVFSGKGTGLKAEGGGGEHVADVACANFIIVVSGILTAGFTYI